MNLIKNMEAVFVVTIGLAGAASYVVDALPSVHALAPASYAASASVPVNSAVVVVSAKRMSAEEKQRSLDAERQQLATRNHARSST